MAAAALLASSAVADFINCGGCNFTPGSELFFEKKCAKAFQNCITQLQGNLSQAYCNDPTGLVTLQQEPDTSGGTGDNLISVAVTDLEYTCMRTGCANGDWGFFNNQWYFFSVDNSCYSNSSKHALSTFPVAPFCVQDPNDSNLNGCYPEPATYSGGFPKPFQVLTRSQSVHGFTSQPKGYNTYGAEALQQATGVIYGYNATTGLLYDQNFVMDQCAELAKEPFKSAGYNLCSLDSGWQASAGVDGDDSSTDEYGRPVYNSTRFNIPKLSSWLHSKGLQLGLYTLLDAPCAAANKTIMGTKTKVGTLFNGNQDLIGLCSINFTNPLAQTYYNSILDLWINDYGVDMMKVDYVTPGSPQNGALLQCDSSPAVEAFNKAIASTGKEIRLDLSWKLCRNETWLPYWNAQSESIRTSQDLNGYGTQELTAWNLIQRTMDDQRQLVSLSMQYGMDLKLYWDMDGLVTLNDATLAGLNDTERATTTAYYIITGSNLILAGDLVDNRDALGKKLLFSEGALAATRFSATYPGQVRNPGTGDVLSKQLNAIIAGPSPTGEAYVLIYNLGEDLGSGGYGTYAPGSQEVTVTLADLGISGSNWEFKSIYSKKKTKVTGSYTTVLAEGASEFLQLTQL
jgi:alpha-galactosidase